MNTGALGLNAGAEGLRSLRDLEEPATVVVVAVAGLLACQ